MYSFLIRWKTNLSYYIFYNISLRLSIKSVKRIVLHRNPFRIPTKIDLLPGVKRPRGTAFFMVSARFRQILNIFNKLRKFSGCKMYVKML